MAHGRYWAFDMDKAQITQPLGENNDTLPQEEKEKPKILGYLGGDLNRLILEYDSKLAQKPTAVIINAGLWPNTGIANNLESIM